MERSAHKLELLRRIAELEKKQLWHLDVEDDPETYPLMPDDIDYLNEKLLNKIKNKWIVNELNQTSTNSGTSKLIQKGFNFIEDSAENKQNNTKEKATFYLSEFQIIENSTLQDYFEVLPNLQTPNLTVTSE